MGWGWDDAMLDQANPIEQIRKQKLTYWRCSIASSHSGSTLMVSRMVSRVDPTYSRRSDDTGDKAMATGRSRPPADRPAMNRD